MAVPITVPMTQAPSGMEDLEQQRALNHVHEALRARLAAAEALEDFDRCALVAAEAKATPRTLLEAVRMAEQAERDTVSEKPYAQLYPERKKRKTKNEANTKVPS